MHHEVRLGIEVDPKAHAAVRGAVKELIEIHGEGFGEELAGTAHRIPNGRARNHKDAAQYRRFHCSFLTSSF